MLRHCDIMEKWPIETGTKKTMKLSILFLFECQSKSISKELPVYRGFLACWDVKIPVYLLSAF